MDRKRSIFSLKRKLEKFRKGIFDGRRAAIVNREGV